MSYATSPYNNYKNNNEFYNYTVFGQSMNEGGPLLKDKLRA